MKVSCRPQSAPAQRKRPQSAPAQRKDAPKVPITFDDTFEYWAKLANTKSGPIRGPSKPKTRLTKMLNNWQLQRGGNPSQMSKINSLKRSRPKSADIRLRKPNLAGFDAPEHVKRFVRSHPLPKTGWIMKASASQPLLRRPVAATERTRQIPTTKRLRPQSASGNRDKSDFALRNPSVAKQGSFLNHSKSAVFQKSTLGSRMYSRGVADRNEVAQQQPMAPLVAKAIVKVTSDEVKKSLKETVPQPEETQAFRRNMREIHDYLVADCAAKGEYTAISKAALKSFAALAELESGEHFELPPDSEEKGGATFRFDARMDKIVERVEDEEEEVSRTRPRFSPSQRVYAMEEEYSEDEDNPDLDEALGHMITNAFSPTERRIRSGSGADVPRRSATMRQGAGFVMEDRPISPPLVQPPCMVVSSFPKRPSPAVRQRPSTACGTRDGGVLAKDQTQHRSAPHLKRPQSAPASRDRSSSVEKHLQRFVQASHFQDDGAMYRSELRAMQRSQLFKANVAQRQRQETRSRFSEPTVRHAIAFGRSQQQPGKKRNSRQPVKATLDNLVDAFVVQKPLNRRMKSPPKRAIRPPDYEGPVLSIPSQQQKQRVENDDEEFHGLRHVFVSDKKKKKKKKRGGR